MIIDKILTVPEIAEYLKVSRTTVWRWCNEGRLPAFRIGRHWRIYRSDIERLIGHKLGELEGAEQETEFA
jgi:excisionase family DNA binding protein